LHTGLAHLKTQQGTSILAQVTRSEALQVILTRSTAVHNIVRQQQQQKMHEVEQGLAAESSIDHTNPNPSLDDFFILYSGAIHPSNLVLERVSIWAPGTMYPLWNHFCQPLAAFISSRMLSQHPCATAGIAVSIARAPTPTDTWGKLAIKET
jgi:hypothetical protein